MIPVKRSGGCSVVDDPILHVKALGSFVSVTQSRLVSVGLLCILIGEQWSSLKAEWILETPLCVCIMDYMTLMRPFSQNALLCHCVF